MEAIFCKNQSRPPKLVLWGAVYCIAKGLCVALESVHGLAVIDHPRRR